MTEELNDYINTLTTAFQCEANLAIASSQKAYMRNKFEFFGLKTPVRRHIQKPFLVKQYLPTKEELPTLVKLLWAQPQRDFQLFAQELVFKYSNKFEETAIELLEFMIVNKSWWDTVDFIATKLVGAYFKSYPHKIDATINTWLVSNNIWLQRSALLFQLKYKKELDTVLLSNIIHSLLETKEFFINKAIGWVLREYSRTNPAWVADFVSKTALSKLSTKEAMRLIHKSI